MTTGVAVCAKRVTPVENARNRDSEEERHEKEEDVRQGSERPAGFQQLDGGQPGSLHGTEPGKEERGVVEGDRLGRQTVGPGLVVDPQDSTSQRPDVIEEVPEPQDRREGEGTPENAREASRGRWQGEPGQSCCRAPEDESVLGCRDTRSTERADLSPTPRSSARGGARRASRLLAALAGIQPHFQDFPRSSQGILPLADLSSGRYDHSS